MSHASADCRKFKQFVVDYNICRETDIYELDDCPKIAEFHSTICKVTSRIRAGAMATPIEKYAVIVLVTGRGVVKDGVLMYALNEFDESTTFYRLIAIEEILKTISIQL